MLGKLGTIREGAVLGQLGKPRDVYERERALEASKKQSIVEEKKQTWETVAREDQKIPQGEWTHWLILAGRGYGKTRTGAETIQHYVQHRKARRIGLIGACLNEIMNVMIQGESGLMTIASHRYRPKFNSTTKTLHWPNGAVGYCIGATNPDKLRGLQFDLVWIDELAKFKNPQALWDQLMFCMRLGKNPKSVITTTPKPIPILKTIMDHPMTHITRGTTFENQHNLSPAFIQSIVKQYEQTSLGSQELYGEILWEKQGALWDRQMIVYQEPPEQFMRIVVAIDPAATHHEQSDETGIVVAGLSEDKKVYILDDLSGRFSPHDWGQRAVQAYHDHHADRIVAEINKGGDMVERIVKSLDAHIAYKPVRATRGKTLRAEPIAALYEQKRVFHVKPMRHLEDQLCSYVPGASSKSPDRLDAMVWAVTDLLLMCESQPVLKIWSV